MPDTLEQVPAVEAPLSLPSPPVADPPLQEPAVESVADHAAQFDPKRREEPASSDTPITDSRPPRHRAKSQQASAEDVEEIARLTKQLREKESELGKVKPDALAASPRVLTLRRQIAAIEAELSSAKPPAATPPPRTPDPTPAATPPAAGFTEPEPTLDEFMGQDDPYAAWTRALARYDRRKDAWEADQARAQAASQQADAESARRDADQLAAHHARMAQFRAARPDFVQKLQAVGDRPLPDLLVRAIIEDDNGPELLYALVNDPVFLDEIQLLSDGKPVTAASVALLRRRLSTQLTRTQAAATGSAAAMPPTSWTSRPPNPVRTSPLKTGDDPPGDGHSLADHAKHFDPKRRK